MIKVSKRKLKEEYRPDVQAQKDTAQLLINFTESSKTFEEAKQIIEESGAHIIEAKYLSHDELLIKMDVRDMRIVVLKLIESGFSNVKGINAISCMAE